MGIAIDVESLPLWHAIVIVERDGDTPPWRHLCWPRVPTEMAPVYKPGGHWPGHFFTDPRSPSRVATEARKIFDALAEAIIPALKDMRLGTFAIERPAETAYTGRKASALWLREIYQIAELKCSRLLDAPRRVLYRLKNRPTYVFGKEQITDKEWAAQRDKSHLSDAEATRFRSLFEPACGEKAFQHEYYSFLCDGYFNVFEASEWALEVLLKDHPPDANRRPASGEGNLPRPRWDGRILYFGDVVCKQFTVDAPVQHKIIEGFQRVNWERRIRSPVQKHELANAVKKLNADLKKHRSPILFRRDGSRAGGVEWYEVNH